MVFGSSHPSSTKKKKKKIVKGPPLKNFSGSTHARLRVRATDRHCRKMRRNNKFGAKNIYLATTIGERKSQVFFLSGVGIVTSGYKSLPRAA